MRRRLAILLACSLVVAACSDFGPTGPGKPECPTGEDISTGELATVILMQLQAIPDARWGACIKGLKVGWDYEAQQTERGRATFWLDSDRMGDHFAEVTLQTSCEPGSAAPAPVSAEGVARSIDVISETSVVEVAVVPVAPRHRNYAEVAGQELKRAWTGVRGIEVTVVDSAEPASVRIASATGSGIAVIVVDDREVAGGKIELLMPGEEPAPGMTPEKAAEELAEDLDPPSYVATWYHQFEGGCIVYDINATGQGAQTAAKDVDEALGFYPLAELREIGRDAGFEL